MRIFGLILIVASVVFLAVLYLPYTAKNDTSAVISQFIGAAALVTMAWTQLIATRLPGIETVFGGMDRSYVLHKWLGIVSMAAILLHDTIDAELRGVRGPILNDLAETLGELSLYSLLILVVISIAVFIPYHLWKWTHRLMGLFYAAGVFHFAFIGKAFANGDPAGLYTLAFSAVGILAYAYTLMPEASRRARPYRVRSVEEDGGATVVTLDPVGRPLRAEAGQFAFVSYDADGLSEPHPFTISRVGDQLRFTIKELGDYTYRLRRRLKAGDTARVQGPHGRFLRNPSARPEIWIAGGIGITPFAAWLTALDDDQTEIHLFYCVARQDQAPHLDEVTQAAKKHANVTLHLIVSQETPRLTAERVAKDSGIDPADAKVYFCGPRPMREALGFGLRMLGLPPKRYHYEEFEIRTGIGLRRLAAWVMARRDARSGQRAT